MSLSNDPIPTFTYEDPRIDATVPMYYAIPRGASEITYRTFNADSFTGGIININTTVNSVDTFVANKIYIRTQFEVVLTLATANIPANTTSTEVIEKFKLFPKFMPLMTACTNVTLSLNGKQLTDQPRRYGEALMRYRNSQLDTATVFSTFPSQLDSLGSFINLWGPTGTFAPAVNSSYINPSNLGKNNKFQESNRIEWFLNNVDSGVVDSATQYTLTFETMEPLLISPCRFGYGEGLGLAGLDTLNIYMNYDQQMLNNATIQRASNAAATIDGGSTLAGISCSIKQCYAEFIYLQPRQNLLLPKILRYRYNNLQLNTKEFSRDNAGKYNSASKSITGCNFSVNSDTYSLQGLPKMVYIFVKRNDGFYSSASARCNTYTFARITGINITLGSRPGILAEASPQQLYEMSVKNGLNDSYDYFKNSVGSVLCVSFEDDIPLNILDAPGTLSKMNFQVKVDGIDLYNDVEIGADFTQIAAIPKLELDVVFVYDGMITIKDRQVLIESSIVSPLDVARHDSIRNLHKSEIFDYTSGSFVGGAKLKDTLVKGFKKAKELGQKAMPYVQKYGPQAVKLGEKAIPVLASLLAAGVEEDQIYKMLMDKKGGKMATKSALKRRAV